MSSNIAKLGDFMPQQKPEQFVVSCVFNGKHLKLYLPMKFKGKRIELFHYHGKLTFRFVKEGGVKIFATQGLTSFAQFGKCHLLENASPFRVKKFEVKMIDHHKDGHPSFDVGYAPEFPKKQKLEKKTKPSKTVVESGIVINGDHKKTAKQCLEFLNKFASENEYKFILQDNKVSMQRMETL